MLLILDIKLNFTVFLNNENYTFNKYLSASLSKNYYVNHMLVHSGVIALGEVLSSIGDEFSNYAGIYIPLLIKILEEEDVKKEVKLTVITLLGQVCYKINIKFLDYLYDVLKIIFGACEIAIEESHNDNDYEEYLQSLRYSLVSTFTLIFYGLEDCNKANLFEPYIKPIFLFFEQLVGKNNLDLRADTLKSMYGFIVDIASSIGRNLKQVLDRSIIDTIVTRINNSKNEKYIKFVENNSENIKLIYS